MRAWWWRAELMTKFARDGQRTYVNASVQVWVCALAEVFLIKFNPATWSP
jgi:hypothetical protein